MRVGGPLKLKHGVHAARHDRAQHLERPARQLAAPLVGFTGHTALGGVERHDGSVLATSAHNAPVQHRRGPLVGQQSQQERRQQHLGVGLVQAAQRSREHLVWHGIIPAIVNRLIHGLDKRHGGTQPIKVGTQRRPAVERHRTRDDVELSSSSVQLQIDVAQQLDVAGQLASCPPGSLRHGTHLAVFAGDDRDDPIGLAELDGAEHHSPVPVLHL